MKQQQLIFEQQKNRKAGAYTLLIMGLLLFLFFVSSWTIPPVYPPLTDEGIEVNLGNSETGMGDIPPMIPGEPAPTSTEQIASTPPSNPTPEDPLASNLNDEDAEAVAVPKKTEKPVLKPRPITNQTASTNNPSKNPPAPPQPKAKATMGTYAGGKGPGGNNQDSYNNTRNQGVAGGSGDQGKPNGNINSDNYQGKGGPGTAGVSISRGLTGRAITRFPSFEDEFNENAKIAVDVKVDDAGRVVSATYQSRGSTSSSGQLKAIAIRKAKELKFNPSDAESIGTVIFNFRLKG